MLSLFGGALSCLPEFLLWERNLPRERGRAPELGLPTISDGVPGRPGWSLVPAWSVRPFSSLLVVFGRGGERSLSLYGSGSNGLLERVRVLPTGILVALSLESVSLIVGGGGGSSFVFMR